MKLKYLYQKLTRGYSDDELWNLDATIARFALPRLKAFRRQEVARYKKLSLYSEYLERFDKMIYALENTANIDYMLDNSESDIALIEARIDEGLELFGEHFRDLCN